MKKKGGVDEKGKRMKRKRRKIVWKKEKKLVGLRLKHSASVIVISKKDMAGHNKVIAG